MRQKNSQELGAPPFNLANNEVIAKVLQNRGNLFDVCVPLSHWPKALRILNLQDSTDDTNLLVKLSPNLRNRLFIQRNGFVVVSLENLGEVAKVRGEITNVVTDKRDWQKTLRDEWPAEFSTSRDTQVELPPSFSDEESESEPESDRDFV